MSGPETHRSIFEKLLRNQLAVLNISATLVQGLPGEPQQSTEGNLSIINHLDAAALQQKIAEAGTVICRSGYSSVMDFVAMQKPAIMVPTPVSYTHLDVYKRQHIVIEAQKENNFLPTAAQIAPHVQGATLIALCSPLNPTGTTFSAEALSAICDLVLEENNRRSPEARKLFLLYDQIYWTLTFGDVQHHSCLLYTSRCV